ncbi:HAD family hydrolase [Candidatus Kaiserbacteria bacterium]|nr:HAD family hydrolase [Candidatus Kaiserbacteria bacterium]
MKKHPEIDWIFFDMGGVLLDDARAIRMSHEFLLAAMRREDPSLTLDHITEVFPEASGRLGDVNRHIVSLLIPEEDKREAILKEVQMQNEAIDYFTLSSVPPETREVLEVLSREYKLGIIANQSIKARQKLTEAGIFSYFDFVGISNELNLSKPDPRIFKAAFEATGAAPEKSVMIDDNIERGLAPAKKLGMKVVWYDLGTRKDSPDWIDFKISRLDDLSRIF